MMDTDWLYELIFEKVERNWKICELSKRTQRWSYVLAEEYRTTNTGESVVTRAWIRDVDGLREISLEEHFSHKRIMFREILYPFILFSFRVDSRHGRFLLNEAGDQSCGFGAAYRIEGMGEEASLEPETNWLV